MQIPSNISDQQNNDCLNNACLNDRESHASNVPTLNMMNDFAWADGLRVSWAGNQHLLNLLDDILNDLYIYNQL